MPAHVLKLVTAFCITLSELTAIINRWTYFKGKHITFMKITLKTGGYVDTILQVFTAAFLTLLPLLYFIFAVSIIFSPSVSISTIHLPAPGTCQISEFSWIWMLYRGCKCCICKWNNIKNIKDVKWNYFIALSSLYVLFNLPYHLDSPPPPPPSSHCDSPVQPSAHLLVCVASP